jgi:hypothetical protein
MSQLMDEDRSPKKEGDKEDRPGVGEEGVDEVG